MSYSDLELADYIATRQTLSVSSFLHTVSLPPSPLVNKSANISIISRQTQIYLVQGPRDIIDI